jgi:ArsR family transcriptional regulator
VPNDTLSFHAKELLPHPGSAVSRPSGQFVYYSPVIEAMNDLIVIQTQCSCGVLLVYDVTPRRSKRRT